MSCPACGGKDREPIAPGFWQCSAIVSWVELVGVDPRFGPAYQRFEKPCGTQYQEGAAVVDQVSCWCGTFAIGHCAACDAPVCGSHSTLSAKGRLCGRCDARIRAPLERAARERAEREKAEAQIAHEQRRIRREEEAVALLDARISELVAAVRTGRDLRAWALGPPLHQSYPFVAKGRSAMGIPHWFRLPKSEFNDWFTLLLSPRPDDGVTPSRNEALFVGEHGAVAHTERVGPSSSARRDKLIALYKPGDTIAEEVRERFFRRNVTKL